MSLENVVSVPNRKESLLEKASQVLITKLKESPLNPEYEVATMTERKERLLKIAEKLPIIAPQLLAMFSQLAKEHSIEPGALGFYIVGGRVLAKPIKDNTDFDFVISAENRLRPGSSGLITYKQRHAIGNALYAEIEKIFDQPEFAGLYEKGILEIKGLGESSAQEVEAQEGVLKLAELG